MNATNYFAFLLLIAVAGGNAMEHKEPLMDLFGEDREICREECGLTREQLREGNEDLQKVRKFLVCLATRVRTIKKDGSINTVVLLKKITPVTPLVIAKPMIGCCIHRVYKGKRPYPHEVDTLLADYITCWKDLLPNSMWNIIGILEPPFYSRLDKCQEW